MTKAVNRPAKPAIGSIRLMAVVCLVVSLLMIIAALALDVQNRLAALDRSDSDNGQWVMMQTEVEVLRLQQALITAHSDLSTVEEVRRWFDVLYSRLQMLDTSPLYMQLIDQPDNRIRLNEMEAFMDRWVPAIDGTDAELQAALAQMIAESGPIQANARAMSLSALLNFSANTDETRTRVHDTLMRLAITTGATISLLLVLAAMATRLYRMTQHQAQEVQFTGARLQMIVATSPDAIVVTNRGGWVVEFNPAAEAMFGLTRNDVMGLQIVPMMFAPENVGPYQAQLNAIIARAVSHGPQRFELIGQRKDGTSFPLEISIAINDLNRGALIVAFMRDVSDRMADRMAVEQALKRARAGEKAKADFLAVMSHEMRTPLNGLLGSMELMGDTELDDNQQELLRVMEVSGEILLGHVNSVLDISAAEAGQIRLVDTPFVLDRLIEDCIASQAGVARTGGNTLRHVALTGSLGTVRGDPGRLQQILLNLIGNAVKFTRNGTITIETERLPRSLGRQDVEIRVIDTGIGIAEADQDRIFEDFATVDSSYGRETGGTGLGLGISRRLAEAMGGALGVESEPGEGSVFWLRLPLPVADAPAAVAPLRAPAERAALPPARAPAAKSAAMNILVIEDNEINRFLLRRYLAGDGHTVTEAADGIEGVAAAEKTRFDLIITDISMPRMDGIEATRRIRAAGASAQARIIALTAHALPEDLDRFRLAGMDACLTKPVTREVLMAHLTNDSGPSGPGPASDGPTPLLDLAPLQELASELGTPMLVNLIQRMLADGDSTIAMISAQPGPSEEVARSAHQLAGSCATFGALPLREALARIEVSIKRGDMAEASAAMASLPGLWQQTRGALAQHAQSMVA